VFCVWELEVIDHQHFSKNETQKTKHPPYFCLQFMTQERFFRMLNDPDLLGNISYEELKTLALAYPYAHNLRYLLALKAQKIDHPEAAKTLSAAAMYSLDRTQLFVYMAPKVIVPQKMMEKEEVLELKPIETVRQELEALSPVPRQEKQVETKVENTAPVVISEVKRTAELDIMPDTQPTEPVVTAPAPEHEPAPPPPVKTTPEPFSSWVSRFQPPALEPRQMPAASETVSPPLPKTSKASTLPPEKGIAQKLAERSVSENKDVISETLARLLVKQGYKEKAIVMYERLCLAFPEKSAFFAAEIEKLKN